MLITDRFVMLNFPKTGSSFARDVMKRIHQPTAWQKLVGKFREVDTGVNEEIVVPFRFKPSKHTYPSQHGVYIQIPSAHRNKAVVSILRDPLDRLISDFEFRHWARYPQLEPEVLAVRFPTFPDLSFEEYITYQYELMSKEVVPDGMHVEIGPQTTQFIRFFATDPLNTMRALREGMDLAAERDKHFAPVHFLHQENLAEELTAFLSTVGYSPDSLRFIAEAPRVNTTERSRPSYLTPDITERVLHAERFLFQLLPEYLPKVQQPHHHATR